MPHHLARVLTLSAAVTSIATPAGAQPAAACDEVTCLTTGRMCCGDGDAARAPGPEDPYPPPAPAPAAAPPPPSAPAPALVDTAPESVPPLAYDGAAAEGAADAAVAEEEPTPPSLRRTLHGFRLGYMFVNDHDVPTDPDDPETSLEVGVEMKSPHLFLIGYEVMRRMHGHSWLDIILVGNVMVAGLEQSKFYPSANALIGFEFNHAFQLGVGPNLTPHPDKPAHILFAGGWTPQVGSFYVPVHAFYVPDVDKVWRAGMTVGVNW